MSIMEILPTFIRKILFRNNMHTYRMYLRITTLADIVDPEGT